MLGTLNTNDRRATVIGGGIGGLIAAYRLMRSGYRVTLIEAQDRLGGLISTTQHPLGSAEGAAHSLLASPPVVSLCQELGVQLLDASPSAKARYLVRGGKMRRMPLRILELIEMLLRILFVRAPTAQERTPNDETLATWAERHLGAAALRWMVAPGVQGIYAAPPSALSVSAAFRRLKVSPGKTLFQHILGMVRAARAERRRTGAPKARRPLRAPRGGMQALTSALEAALCGSDRVTIKTRTPVGQLPRVEDVGNLILALPSEALAKLLAPYDAALADSCRKIQYAPLVSITVFVERRQFRVPPRGVGVLIPRDEKIACLGFLFNSSAFEGRVHDPEKWVSLTALFGGVTEPLGSASPGSVSTSLNDEQLLHEIERTLALYFHPTGRPAAGPPTFSIDPQNMVVHRWPAAVPIYSSAVLDVHRAFAQGWGSRPGHLLGGNLAGEVSIRGMIESGEALST
jgi:oxygen-dependent protoporphyrinogen oxidase